VQPAQVPGQQGEDRGDEDDGQQSTDPTQHGRTAGARTHPGPAQAAQPQGQKKSGKAERLEQQVAEPGAEQAHPVAGGVDGLVRGGVQRRVRWEVGSQREEEHQRSQHQYQPQKDVQGAAPRRG